MFNFSACLSVLLVLLLQTVSSEVIPLQLILDATSEEVHYIKGWLEAPSHMDLSELKFVTTAEPEFEHGDDLYDDDKYNDDFADESTLVPSDENTEETTESDTEAPTPMTDAPTAAQADQSPAPVDTSNNADTPAPTPGNTPGDDSNNPADNEGGDGGDDNNDGGDGGDNAGGDDGDGGDDAGGDGGDGGDNAGDGDDVPTDAPTLDDDGDRARLLEGGNGGGISQRTTQVLDFVVFFLPEDCVKNDWGGCSWAALGVGAYDDEVEGEISYCCSEDTVARNLCDADDLGKLIVNHDIFQGQHRKVEVPTEAEKEFYLDDPVFKQDVSGDYIMVLGNCDDYGMDVLAVGSMEWKSLRGNLPGDMYNLMLFYWALTAFYFLLVIWYGIGIRVYQEAAIPIQKYIAATMILGLLELTFRAVDLGIWNAIGFRVESVAFISLSLGVLKRGISRCLGVMVAMGWGVVRESLGTTLIQIVFLGLLYSGLTLFRDIFVVVAAEKVETISISAEEELIDFAFLLTPIIIVINIIFFVWIIRSLSATTAYLQNMNQTSKLRRHSRLRCIFIIAMIVAGTWLSFTIYDVLFDVLSTDQMWILEGVMHVNYLFLLTGVSILWRPNSNAKDYAMQMELPAFGEDDENELELSCVVPSAGDMDDGNDPDHTNGIRADDGIMS